MSATTYDTLLVPLDDIPGFVHGIVSLDPPKIQCDGCRLIATGDDLNLLILTCGITFDTRGGEGWEKRRLCRDCRGRS